MFYTKKWGVVSSKAELYMLNRAEHELEKKRKGDKRHGKNHLPITRN